MFKKLIFGVCQSTLPWGYIAIHPNLRIIEYQKGIILLVNEELLLQFLKGSGNGKELTDTQLNRRELEGIVNHLFTNEMTGPSRALLSR